MSVNHWETYELFGELWWGKGFASCKSEKSASALLRPSEIPLQCSGRRKQKNGSELGIVGLFTGIWPLPEFPLLGPKGHPAPAHVPAPKNIFQAWIWRNTTPLGNHGRNYCRLGREDPNQYPVMNCASHGIHVVVCTSFLPIIGSLVRFRPFVEQHLSGRYLCGKIRTGNDKCTWVVTGRLQEQDQPVVDIPNGGL